MGLGEIVGTIIFGAVIGVIARLVIPGKQAMGWIITIAIGVVGALVGYWLSGELGVGDTSGIDWIRWIISIVVAVVLTLGYTAVTRNKV